jgi:hypothetical protein
MAGVKKSRLTVFKNQVCWNTEKHTNQYGQDSIRFSTNKLLFPLIPRQEIVMAQFLWQNDKNRYRSEYRNVNSR